MVGVGDPIVAKDPDKVIRRALARGDLATADSVGADPAVFSNPFITTFVDATGLVVYFLIAKAVLHI